MLRFVALAVLLLLLFLVLRASVRAFLSGYAGEGRRTRPRLGRDDLLVKDPVCQTYIPRRKAIARGTGDATRYFCSADCADRYAARS